MFSIAFLVFITLAAIQRFGMEGRGHRRAKRGAVKWTWTGYVMVVCHILTYSGTVIEFLLGHQYTTLNPLLSSIGIGLFLLGFLLRRWAILTLGPYWSVQIELRPDQPLIRTGPYRFIRHPNYVALVLEVLGLPLIGNASYTFVAVVLCYSPLIFFRLVAEERALLAAFPQAYRQYQQATGAVFPKISCFWKRS